MKSFLFCGILTVLCSTIILAQSTDPVVRFSTPIPRSYQQAFQFDHRFEPEAKASKPGLITAMKEEPGVAFLSSAILPGASQFAAGNWIRGSIYSGIEAAAIYTHFSRETAGRRGERRYERFADQNWSVKKYALYLVDFHNYYFPNDQRSIQEFAMPGMIIDRNNLKFGREAWPYIDIAALRAFERTIRFGGTSGNILSHPIQDFGSQQYYELMSKYGQFGPGWRDFAGEYYMEPGVMTWSVNDMSPMFWQGVRKAEEFNENLRTARLMFTVLIANHVFSGFDGFFSTKLRNHRLSPTTTQLGQSMGYGIRIGF